MLIHLLSARPTVFKGYPAFIISDYRLPILIPRFQSALPTTPSLTDAVAGQSLQSPAHRIEFQKLVESFFLNNLYILRVLQDTWSLHTGKFVHDKHLLVSTAFLDKDRR